jgi:WD40 repeat protein/tetratricopeptide (TPR) repeat protein/tRNA A-37 threonylcarbamoyl transferase component Bud32
MSQAPLTHPTADELRALSLGQLGGVELARVSAHLGDCPECCRRIDELAAADPLLARLQQSAARGGKALVSRARRRSAVRALRRGQGARAAEGSGEAATEPVILPAPRRVGDYDILAEVGRGGMGVVYKARHRGLRRLAALKMVLAGEFASPAQEVRFRLEAELAAPVQHPNIVQVYEIGSYQGRPFLAMEWVEGGSLANRLDGTPWPPGAAASLVETLARAIHVAHAEGVVHRDLKPANILLQKGEGAMTTDQGESSRSGFTADPASGLLPKITDFGLARPTEGGVTLTQSGFLVGTPGYMAPEQAAGSGRGALVGPATDIYALGVVLYQLLTGQLPFQGDSTLEVLRAVTSDEPVRLRRLQPHLPRDLEAITLHCLEKEPTRRYPSALALAEDLQRFREGKQVAARPVGAAARLARSCRRHPLIAVLLGLLMVSLFGGLAGVTWMWWKAESNLREADRQRLLVARTRNDSLRQSAGLLLDRGIARAEEGDTASGLHWMLEGLKVAPAEAVELRRAIRVNLAAWSEPVYALRQIIRFASPVHACAFTPDGARILIASGERLEYRDARTLLPTGESIRSQSPADQVALSPDGKLLVTGHERGGVQRWDVKTGMPIGAPLPTGGVACRLALSPDGKAILIGCRDGTARIWDAVTGEPLGAPFESRQAVLSVAFAPDGRSVLIGTASDGRIATASLWDIATRARLAGPFAHQEGVGAVAFNPAGATVLTGSGDGIAQLWERETNRPAGPPLRHRNGLDHTSFTPDGGTILTVSMNDLSAYLWETATGQRIGTPLWQSDRIDCFAISPDGRTVACGGADAAARVWEIGRGRSRPLDRVEGRKGPVDLGSQDEPRLPGYYLKKTVVYSPDRRAVLTSDGGRIARLWETSTGRPLGAPLRHGRNVRTVAFSPDGTRVATASHDCSAGLMDSKLSSIRIWDAATGRPLGPPIWQYRWVSALAFSPDGRVLAAGDYGQAVRFWDATTGRPVGAPIAQQGIVFGLAFSADGKTLAVGTVVPTVEARLWDLATGRPIGNGMPHKNWVVDVAFSPDGRALLTRSHDSTARLWDARTAEPLTEPMQHQGCPVVAFSPDGRRLASAGGLENEVQIRDAATGRPLPGAVLGHASQVTALAFSPDGRQLGVGCKDGSARLWDVATARPLGPAMVQRSPIVAVTFTPDGRDFLSTAADGTTRSWPVPGPLGGDVDRLALRLQVLTGMRMEAGQHVEKLAAETWEERSLRLKEVEGTVAGAYATSVSPAAYHDARARDAEQDGNTFAARWHLDRLIDRRGMADDDDDVPVRWLLHARRARACSTAGQFDGADADYRRAEDLSSPAIMLDWYRQRVADCERTSQWRTALWYLDRCLAAEPTNGELYAIRARVFGRLGRPEDHLADLTRAAELGAEEEILIALADEHAALGRWARAAALYAEARRRGPVPLPAWVRGALVDLEVGDPAGYRSLCRALLGRHSKVETPEEAEFIARACALGPEATDDLQAAVDLAELAVGRCAPAERPDVLCTLGAIRYRAGRVPDALARLEESVAAKPGRRVIRDLFLAMAQHRLGGAAEAQRTFDEATRRIGSLRGDDTPMSWPDWVEIEVLRREAQALILGPRGDAGDRQ